jgi:protein-disulfide isomerase
MVFRAALAALLMALTCVPARAQQGRVSAGGIAIILNSPGVPAMGSQDAAVTVVEYMDYNCPYCRKMAPDLVELAATDHRVRIVFKDWPIFGAVSEYAARAAIAANAQEKYLAAYGALIATRERLTRIEQVREALKTAGIDLIRLDRDLQDHGKEIDALITRNREEAAALGLHGTPGVIVGDLLVYGSLSYDEMRRLVARVKDGA